jgi:hypothetical protein
VNRRRRRRSIKNERLGTDVIATRRRRLTELRLMGWTSAECAKELECSERTIHGDLAVLKEDWQRDIRANRDRLMADQVEHLSFIRWKAIEAWFKSMENAQKKVVKEVAEGGTEITTTIEGQYGDPRFLELVRKATQDLRDLYGLIDPQLANARQTAESVISDVIEVVIEDRAQLAEFCDESGSISIDAFRRRLIALGAAGQQGGNGNGHVGHN